MSGMTDAEALAAIDTVARGCALHADKCVGSVAERWIDACTNSYDNARDHFAAMIAERDALRNAAVQSLDDFCWAEQTVPGTNFQASILLLRHALKFQEAEQANVRT